MYWNRLQLEDAILANDPRIRNYFDTFGFAVIRNFTSKSDFDRLLAEYENQYELRNKQPKTDGMRFLPNFVDSSEVFTNHFFSEETQDIYRYFAGNDYLYLGSDGSQFITTSFPWHRDWFTKMPVLKFNFYFNPTPFTGGKFLIIPGSQFTEDAYAGLIQKSMAWPMQNKQIGGMGENDFLPPTTNPRHDPSEETINQPDIPHVEIEIKQGDLIIFDQRCVHCVQATNPTVTRNLLTVLLSKNAYEFTDDHYLIKRGHKREDLMREIIDLVVSERNHIKCPSFGKAIYNHPFSKSRNFITMNKLPTNTPSDNLPYNSGSFTNGATFTSNLDAAHYAKIGINYKNSVENKDLKTDKLSQQYGYGDIHLGINAQNIKPISNT